MDGDSVRFDRVGGDGEVEAARRRPGQSHHGDTVGHVNVAIESTWSRPATMSMSGPPVVWGGLQVVTATRSSTVIAVLPRLAFSSNHPASA